MKGDIFLHKWRGKSKSPLLIKEKPQRCDAAIEPLMKVLLLTLQSCRLDALQKLSSYPQISRLPVSHGTFSSRHRVCSRQFYPQDLLNDNVKLLASESASLHPPKSTLIMRKGTARCGRAESQQPCDTQRPHPAQHVNN